MVRGEWGGVGWFSSLLEAWMMDYGDGVGG
jgi:hypothetical protein